ncbi:MAG: DUF2877 domain-containing protein [Micrococcales bacterium]|nr:DUF2877 domain-containing protein [Micrococcales bacterium]
MTLPLRCASAPAVRALRAGGWRGVLAAHYDHTVNVGCAGWIVNLSAAAPQSVCSAQVDVAALAWLRTLAIGQVVELSPPGREVSMAPVLGVWPPDRAARGILHGGRVGTWFDTPEGHRFGAPRLACAARAAAALALGDPASDGPALDGPAPGEPVPASAAFADLLGVGIGLTPAGDDALVGMLAALTVAGVNVASLRALAGLLTPSDGATTDVSATILRLALAGEFSLPLHAVLAAIGDAERLPRAVEALRGWGATSGRDTVAGLDALATAWAAERKE